MAAPVKNPELASPFAGLSQETIKALENIGAELDKAEYNIETLELIGRDASKLREQLAWGRKVRDTVLKRGIKT